MELINKQYALASAVSGLVRTDENGEKWIRVKDVRESIMNVPTIEAESVKHGHNLTSNTLFECSECGYYNDDTTRGTTRIFNYCPNCGARMDEKEKKNV